MTLVMPFTANGKMRPLPIPGISTDSLARPRGGAPELPESQSVGHPSGLSLTRRGRLVIVALFALAIAFGMTMLPAPRSEGGQLLAAPESGAAAASALAGGLAVEYTVRQGDSLWAIASVLVPGGDPRAMVHRLREVNGLGGSQLAVGQVLVLPVSPAASS